MSSVASPFGRSIKSSARDAEGGFSLIEVVITIGIMMSLTLAVASMLRGGFEVKEGLSQKAKIIHRLTVAMNKLSDDIQHAFLVSTKDVAKNGIGRNMKTLFKIEKTGSGDKLSLTTKTHRPMHAGAYESELTYVTYELLDSKVATGRKDLFRSESAYIPSDLKEEQPMRLLARNIKTMTLEFWTGERWSKDYWDTGRSDTRGRLPKLVRITLEAQSQERVDGDGQDESQDQATEKLQTVVYVADSWEYQELKEQDKSIKWSNF